MRHRLYYNFESISNILTMVNSRENNVFNRYFLRTVCRTLVAYNVGYARYNSR